MQLFSKAINTNKRLQKLINKADKRNHGAENLKIASISVNNETQLINSNIQSIIDELNRYGLNDHHISLPMAVSEAKSILQNIHDRSAIEILRKNSLNCARDSYYTWGNASEILTQQVIEIGQFKLEIGNVLVRLTDLSKNSHKTQQHLENAVAMHAANVRNYNNLVERENFIKKLKNEIYDVFNSSIVPRTDELFEEIEDNREKVQQYLIDIDDLKDIVHETNEECADGLKDIRNNWLPEAKDHAHDLTLRARAYADLFSSTKTGAEVALSAR